MLIKDTQACLLMVDMQERLLTAIHDAGALQARVGWLLDIAHRLEVPVLASEQYPRGLGYTVAALRRRLDNTMLMEKTRFACTAEPACEARMRAGGRKQWVVVGAEAHVCVLQTALGLLGWGHEVYVVADAVGSRQPAERDLALARLRQEGVRVVSAEMVAFEWLYEAGTERFREISREFLR